MWSEIVHELQLTLLFFPTIAGFVHLDYGIWSVNMKFCADGSNEVALVCMQHELITNIEDFYPPALDVSIL